MANARIFTLLNFFLQIPVCYGYWIAPRKTLRKPWFNKMFSFNSKKKDYTTIRLRRKRCLKPKFICLKFEFNSV